MSTVPATFRPGLPGAFGRLTLGFLWVAVASGVALAPFWEAGRARESVEVLAGALPWGWWLRGVHARAGDGTLICLLLHLGDVLWRRSQGAMPYGMYLRSIGTLPLLVLALVTGFGMRGDGAGIAALEVLRGVLGSVPWIGEPLSLLVAGTGPDLSAAGLQHAGAATLGLLALSVEHGRRWWPDRETGALALVISGALGGLWPPGLEVLEGPGPLRGPFVLWGLQGWLSWLPVWSGWVLPLAGLAAVGLWPRSLRPWMRGVLGMLLGLLLLLWLAGTLRVVFGDFP